MATYTGNVSDLGFSPTLPGLRVVFVPGEGAVGVRSERGRVVSSKPVVVTPDAAGAFSVELVASDLLVGATVSTVVTTMRVEWLDAAGQFTGLDVYRLLLRAAGGSVSDMVATGVSQPAHVLVREVEPVPWPVGWVWVNSFNGDALRRVR